MSLNNMCRSYFPVQVLLNSLGDMLRFLTVQEATKVFLSRNSTGIVNNNDFLDALVHSIFDEL